MTGSVVHLVNGDHAAGALAAAGLGLSPIVWRDVLHDGPVHDLAPDALARERAAFVAAAGWGTREAVHAAFTERDRRLEAAFATADELVLWLAPGVHDQLQRIQVLARAARCTGRRATLREAAIEAPAALLDGTALQAAFARRRPVGGAALARALDAWLAFTSVDARDLDRLLDADDDGSPLLDAAIKRWREEFPAAGNGLGRTERQLLEALARGVFRARDAWVAACRHAEDQPFLADLPFASLACRLSACAVPLLSHPDQRPLAMPDPTSDGRVFWNDSLLATRAGRERLAGIGDWMADAPPRWMGGVLLHGTAGWRWDPAVNRLREGPAR